MNFTEKQLKYHNLYLDLAERIAEMSYAERLKVGAILVNDDNIISYGFNGMPSGMPNCCENVISKEYLGVDGYLEHTETKPEVIHAELNAILKAAKCGVSIKNSVLYTNYAPCLNCAKHILQVDIDKVFFRKYYRDKAGVNFLIENGIECQMIKNHTF